MSNEAPAEPSCKVCHKPQSELPNPLKCCAKCHTQSYCSRDCQKADWSRHKRECASASAASSRPAATVPRGPSRAAHSSSRNNNKPSNDEILQLAQQTVNFMTALSHCTGFQPHLKSMPASASGLMYLCDFFQRTFYEYWAPLLPPQRFAEMAADLESFTGISKEQHLEKYATNFVEEKRVDPSFDKDAWPELDEEKYNDIISRNVMGAMLVNDGRGLTGSYEFPREVKDMAGRMTRP